MPLGGRGATPGYGKDRVPRRSRQHHGDGTESCWRIKEALITMRRLNRSAEYQNTIRELLGVEIRVGSELPSDTRIGQLRLGQAPESVHVGESV